MATNKFTYRGTVADANARPMRILGKFQAGSTQQVKRGEIIELDSGNWIPLDADQAMAGVIAIADEEITEVSKAGYYPIIVPRPGDLFEYPLDTAGNPDRGTALYWSDSETVTETVGSNVLANVYDHAGFPLQQGKADVGDVADRGTTIGNANRVLLTFKAAASYFAALQT